MARNSHEGQSDRDRWTFGRLLDWHLLRGTRPGGKIDHPGRKWSAKAFAEAVGFGDRTIRYWLRNEHLPPEIDTIERVLFGNDICYAEWRLELRHAHAASWATRNDQIAPASADAQAEQHSRTRKVLPASNIPIRLPTHFMGREDALEAIETTLKHYEDRVAITALYGLRGIGKTTLAAAYADRHRGDYRAIWWIRAQTQLSMRADLVALGVRLDWIAGDENEEPALGSVMERLRYEGDGILLIYDNAVDANTLKPYLPRGGVARVLVTSTAYAWRGVAAPVEIRVWTKEIGADYLIARTGRAGDGVAAEALSQVLGGLPLAHEQAAAYCERLDISFADYRERFEATPARLLDDARNAPAEYYDGLTVAKTFALAIDEAAKLCRAAEPLIVHAALLAPEPIPLFLFTEAREKFDEPLATALAGDGIDEAVAALRGFALLDRETIADERDASLTTDTIRLHRLVREVAATRRAATAREDVRRVLVEAVTSVYSEYVWRDPSTWPRARRLDGIGLALVGGEMDPPKGAEAAAGELLDRLAQYRHRALGDFPSARPLKERALKVREKAFGPEHPDTATSLNNLANLLYDQGDFAAAREVHERALAIRKKVLAPEHPDTAFSHHNLALSLQAQGDLAGARPLCERALAIREKVLGPEHPLTAASLTVLTDLLLTQGDFAGAQPLVERGLAIHEKVLGPEHPNTAASLSNLARLLQAQGDLVGARPLYKRGLAIHEKVLGPEHPNTATSLSNLACVLQAQGDLVGARPLYERALAIREKVLGPEHALTATSLDDLAILLQAQGDFAGAQPLVERALPIFEKVLGPEHPNTNRGRRNLARLLSAIGNPAEALAWGEAALAAHEKVLGNDHPWTKDSARATAEALDTLGRSNEAVSLRARFGLLAG